MSTEPAKKVISQTVTNTVRLHNGWRTYYETAYDDGSVERESSTTYRTEAGYVRLFDGPLYQYGTE